MVAKYGKEFKLVGMAFHRWSSGVKLLRRGLEVWGAMYTAFFQRSKVRTFTETVGKYKAPLLEMLTLFEAV